jgi:hypothetical protein
MLITAEDLFERFKEEHLNEFNHLSEKELQSACTSQYEQIKQTMESGVLDDVRLQYIFSIKVMRFRVIKHLKSMYLNYSKGNIKERNFKKYAIMLLDYIQKNPTKFEKYEDTIQEVTGFSKEDIQQKVYQSNPGKKYNN